MKKIILHPGNPPIEPQKTRKMPNILINIDNNVTLEHLVDVAKKSKIPLKDCIISFEMREYGEWGNEYINSVDLQYYEEVENKNYNKEYKQYSIQLEKYNKQLEEYKEYEKHLKKMNKIKKQAMQKLTQEEKEALKIL